MCAANPALCQRLWDQESSPWLPSFSSSFPGTGTAALPPRALSSAGQTPARPGSFLQPFIFKEAGKKAISFLLSRLGHFRPSLEQPLSACTGSASGQKARPTSSLPHPGAWAGSGFFSFPKAGFSSQLSLSEEMELSLSVPASGCYQGGIFGLRTLLAPVSPWLDSQLCSEPRFVIPVFFLRPALPGASCSCLLSEAAYGCLYPYISLVYNYICVCTGHINVVLWINQRNRKVLTQESELETGD